MGVKRGTNPVHGKKATVALHRNGLSITIEDVPAANAAAVAGVLLTAMRVMVDNGFDELIQDAGGVASGALGEVPDEYEVTETRARPANGRRRLGFT
jgi:hypothetical protein